MRERETSQQMALSIPNISLLPASKNSKAPRIQTSQPSQDRSQQEPRTKTKPQPTLCTDTHSERLQIY